MRRVVTTSVPVDSSWLANVAAEGGTAEVCRVTRLAKVPNGTGDLLSGLYIGHLVLGVPPTDALGRAVAGVAMAITNSAGANDLQLRIASGAADWTRVEPASVSVS
jgi:pyridoxine kinase